ncbi:MAG: DUF1080 domain-containing protein [Saprospiraceae bacterium]|nr:DUF1080 domain-containing protein [Saprospiraceae bacterium]
MRFFALLLLLLPVFPAYAQEILPLTDMSAWIQNGGSNWQIAGDAIASLTKDDHMTAAKGAGVLVNLPSKKSRANLLSVREYGDVDVSFDFMMARHSNSGFYLQGRYEVQLLDSWGVQHPGFGDCGGIYARRRWNPKEELFDGVAPRVNACLAPGLWQHLEIEFQAPRFDANGKKTSNARLLKVVLNGTVIHENLELTGPTGGPISEQEAATGPFMIQGDHGPVAFRNCRITDRRGTPVAVSKPFSYRVINGAFRSPDGFAGKKADLEGVTDLLSWEVAKRDNEYAIVFNGEITVKEPGQHRITLHNSGRSSLQLNGKEVLADEWSSWNRPRSLTLDLPAGNNSLTLTVYKMDTWLKPYLAFWVEGPKARAVGLHSKSATLALTPPDPIYLDAPEPKVFRSFMDITPFGGEKKRVVHAAQVGDPGRLHYTYDLDNGAVPQIWKGDFLDVSPMWDDRGDGSSRPRGAVLHLKDVAPLVPETELWNTQASGNAPAEGFRPQGYDLDEQGLPVFRYTLNGMEVEDRLRVKEGKYLNRTLDCRNVQAGYVCRLALGASIEQVDKNIWAVDGKRYFIQVPAGVKPVLKQSKGMAALYVPLGSRVEYAIMW